MKKLINGVCHLFFALTIMLSAAACDIGLNIPGNETPSTPNTPTGPTNPNTPTYDDFNKADYVIENESGKSDSEIENLKDQIWLMYAENEHAGDWMTNYVKTNKIKTILSNKVGAQAWIDPNQLDRLYLNEEIWNWLVPSKEHDDNYKAAVRGGIKNFATHETMHLVQYKGNAFNLMNGMRPDICAAVDMLTEFLAWFYTEERYPGTVITADMKDAVETQSKYMILSTDPWEYAAACAKDPSLPSKEWMGVHRTPWFNNSLDIYAIQAFKIGIVSRSAFTPPFRQASKEDMLKVARAMLACRDPKMAGVTDDALWTVFDALHKAANGDSKYLHWGMIQESFDDFQNIISAWEMEYEAQQGRLVTF